MSSPIEPASPVRSIAEFDPLSPLTFKRRTISSGFKNSSLNSIKPNSIQLPPPLLPANPTQSRFNQIPTPPLSTPSESPTEEPLNRFESTPLPKLPMTVLAICMFSGTFTLVLHDFVLIEFSQNSSQPRLLVPFYSLCSNRWE